MIYCSFLLLSYVTNPAQTSRVFAGRTGFFFNTLIFVIESVITHYILIFGLILPVMRKQRTFRNAVIIGLLFFLAKFAYDYISFLIERAERARDMAAASPAALPEDSMRWVLIMSYVFVLIASFSVALLIEWVHKDRERIMLEKDKTEAELKALKHQINPHFLFNSLSFIYGKVIKLDKETADSILMLANIMRYALGKSTRIDGTVNIMDELEHLKNVIEINQRRHNHQLASGTAITSNNATTTTNYATKVSLDIYTDQGSTYYNKSRSSFGSQIDSYVSTLDYLIKRTPFGSKNR
ncbi:histidine kinase [Dyadobacter sp. CY323]|nr:histidine kinase [Dyadobacter sp. CY323]